MTGPDVSDTIVVEVRVDAPPETVFAFFVDPERLLRWMGLDAALDPRPGGIFRVDVNGRDVAEGEFVEVVPHERVVFTWGWRGGANGLPPGASTVEVTLAPEGAGTLVRLRHGGLGAAGGTYREGWEHYLPRLAIAAAGGDPGADPWTSPEGMPLPSS
jgi:uncharacterized protein YndB with AHSA1/START domain